MKATGVGFIFLLALSPCCLRGQSRPNARDLLIRSGAMLSGNAPFQIRGTWVVDLDVPNKPARTEASFSFDSAGARRFHYEVAIGATRKLAVSDGVNTWTYVAPANVYRREPGSPGFSHTEFEDILFGSDAANIKSARLAGEESLTLEGKEIRCSVVHAEYVHLPGVKTGQRVMRTVWLERDNNFVRRDLWEGKVELVASIEVPVRVRFDYNSIRIGGPLAESLFSFQPPEGSRETNSHETDFEVHTGPFAAVENATRAAMAGISGSPVDTRFPVPEAQLSEEARAAGYQGTAVVYLEVDSSGFPRNVQIIAGLGLGLDEKAMEAVSQWRFKPGLRSPAAEAVEVPFRIDAGWRVLPTPFQVETGNSPIKRQIRQPVLTRYVRPDAAACSAGGITVPVDIVIDKQGEPRNVRAGQAANPAASEAVTKAVSGWRFVPASLNGKPAEARGRIDLACGPSQTVTTVGAAASPPPFRVGGGVSPPRIMYKVEPEYSEEARKAKYQGTVLLYLEVDPYGNPRNLRTLRMLGLGLDKKALEAVRRWRFTPGMKDGRPVTVAATIEVNFKLL